MTVPEEHIYIAIDLKSFYASVECVERRLDPLTADLVVADESRTEKTICLAVTPHLKSYGIPGRARLFEVIQKVNEINSGNPEKPLTFIAAPPRMKLYMDYSTRIYNIYLKYVSAADIHVYSVDEVFIDVTSYLSLYGKTPKDLAVAMIRDVFGQTGITATAGIGTNLYLAKVAMDIMAKHSPADENGVRLAQLDEMSYRRALWTHRPLTDFWRVGSGYAKKLAKYQLFTMGDIARCSVGKENDYYNEDLLYRLFGVNAELLIDHAWGYEPATIADIKAYRPEHNSLSNGQVLSCPYDAKKARVVILEMTDLLVLELVEKGLVTDQIVLTVGYDKDFFDEYSGDLSTDRYGRKIPKHAHGSINLGSYTSSTSLIMQKTGELFDSIIDPKLSARRMSVTANHVIPETQARESCYEQLDLFSLNSHDSGSRNPKEKNAGDEKQLQLAMLEIKHKYGKNAILRGLNFEEGSTAIQRNREIGGHRA